MKQNLIYAIGVPTSPLGPVKIGRTTRQIELRLADLQRGDQVIVPPNLDRAALEVLYAAEAEPWVERRLHVHFHRYRVCGEWFALNPAVVRREVKMAVNEILREAERTRRAPTTAQRVSPARQLELFHEWIEAGFTEDQALRMVAMLASRPIDGDAALDDLGPITQR